MIIKMRYSGEELLKGVKPELEKMKEEGKRRKCQYKQRSRSSIQ